MSNSSRVTNPEKGLDPAWPGLGRRVTALVGVVGVLLQ